VLHNKLLHVIQLVAIGADAELYESIMTTSSVYMRVSVVQSFFIPVLCIMIYSGYPDCYCCTISTDNLPLSLYIRMKKSTGQVLQEIVKRRMMTT
jgi:hypothetical protein